MAIERIDAPADPFAATTDWTKLLAQVATLFLGANGPILNIIGGEVVKGSVFQIGGAIYYGSSDTTITGVASDYVQITASGASATAAYVADLTGVTWNEARNGWYDVDGKLYVFNEDNALRLAEITTAHEKYLLKDEYGDSFVEKDIYVGNDVIAGGTVRGAISSGANAVDNTETASFTADALDIGEIQGYGIAPGIADIVVTLPATSDSQYEVTVFSKTDILDWTGLYIYRIYAASATFTLPHSGYAHFSVLIKRVA